MKSTPINNITSVVSLIEQLIVNSAATLTLLLEEGFVDMGRLIYAMLTLSVSCLQNAEC